MQKYSIQPQFIAGGKGNLFCIKVIAGQNKHPGHTILILPPFAEEMNKSRHMLANITYLSAQLGYDVVSFDLFGTGDSQGEFGESTWDIWIDDIFTMLHWLKASNTDTISLIALRTGSLFLEPILQNSPLNIDKLILWQPVINGGLFLNQFIRLKLAADMMADSTTRISAKDIRHQLENGNPFEIAGYMLNPELYNPMANLNLSSLQHVTCPAIYWYEIAPSLEQTFTPASQRVIDELKQAGIKIHLTPIQGPQFWSTAEITEVQTLLDETLSILKG